MPNSRFGRCLAAHAASDSPTHRRRAATGSREFASRANAAPTSVSARVSVTSSVRACHSVGSYTIFNHLNHLRGVGASGTVGAAAKQLLSDVAARHDIRASALVQRNRDALLHAGAVQVATADVHSGALVERGRGAGLRDGRRFGVYAHVSPVGAAARRLLWDVLASATPMLAAAHSSAAFATHVSSAERVVSS